MWQIMVKQWQQGQRRHKMAQSGWKVVKMGKKLPKRSYTWQNMAKKHQRNGKK